MAESLPYPQDGTGSRAEAHNETGVGHLFMLPDPGRQIVALRPTRMDAPRGECYSSFEPVPKIQVLFIGLIRTPGRRPIGSAP
jgi:hypothetical protein